MLTEEQVKHVAKLAKLTITDEEIPKLQEQLGTILDYVGQVKEVNTEGIEPTSQTTGLENISRDDKVETSLAPDSVFLGAKRKKDHLFEVDPVFDK